MSKVTGFAENAIISKPIARVTFSSKNTDRKMYVSKFLLFMFSFPQSPFLIANWITVFELFFGALSFPVWCE